MYRLIFDPLDASFLLTQITPQGFIAYTWFTIDSIHKSLSATRHIYYPLEHYLKPYYTITTFTSRPSIIEITTFIYSKPELLI